MNGWIRTLGMWGAVVCASWLWVRCTPGWQQALEAQRALVGVHHELGAAADCTACHPADQPIGPASPDCTACHEADRPMGHFPGECADCHDLVSWQGATFNHPTPFPFNHANANACADCHPGGDTSSFSCLDGCHGNRVELGNEHDEVGGYQYDSAACLDCHPRGQGD